MQQYMKALTHVKVGPPPFEKCLLRSEIKSVVAGHLFFKFEHLYQFSCFPKALYPFPLLFVPLVFVPSFPLLCKGPSDKASAIPEKSHFAFCRVTETKVERILCDIF